MSEKKPNIDPSPVRLSVESKEWLDELQFSIKNATKVKPPLHELVDRAIGALKREIAASGKPARRELIPRNPEDNGGRGTSQDKSTIHSGGPVDIESGKTGKPLPEFTEREWPWVEKLLAVLRSGNERAIKAVSENLDVFADYVQIANVDRNAVAKKPPTKRKGGAV